MLEPLVDAISDAICAFEDGRSVCEVACLRTAALVHAQAAAHAVFDKSWRSCTLTYWSDIHESVRRHVVTDESGSTGASWTASTACATLTEQWRHPVMTELPLTEETRPTRLLVLARCTPFAPADLELIRLMRRPLVALEAHVRRVRTPSSATDPEADPAAGWCEAGDLTPRELEVLQMLSHGLLAASIASRMDVSPRTVHKHLGNVYRKLNAHDRLQAVNRARALGLLA